METQTKKHDIQNLKEVIVLGLDFGAALKRARADGKLDVRDLFQLMPVLESIGPAYDDIKMVIPEVKDLDEQEATELLQVVKSRLPEVTDDAEVMLIAERSLKFVLAGAQLVAAF